MIAIDVDQVERASLGSEFLQLKMAVALTQFDATSPVRGPQASLNLAGGKLLGIGQIGVDAGPQIHCGCLFQRRLAQDLHKRAAGAAANFEIRNGPQPVSEKREADVIVPEGRSR